MAKHVLNFDEYRVSMFKKLIRSELPLMRGLRFERSKGRCNLIINAYRYYGREEEVRAYVSGELKRAGIDFHEERFAWGDGKLHYIRIPIDQAALPERKRFTFAKHAKGSPE